MNEFLIHDFTVDTKKTGLSQKKFGFLNKNPDRHKKYGLFI